MADLIKFGGVNDRGPSASLWGGIVDQLSGPVAMAEFAGGFDDFTPFLGSDVGITISGDTGAALAANVEPYGVLDSTCDQAADAVAGFTINEYVDLNASTFKKFGMEVKFNVVDDNDTTQIFFGLTDEALDGQFGTDNTPDGSAFGLLWRGDETVDLVSISSADAITVVIDDIATVERTVGEVRFGFTIELIGDGKYLCRANLGRVEDSEFVETTKEATTTTVPGEAMQPFISHTNDNEAAPNIEIDWYVRYNKSNV